MCETFFVSLIKFASTAAKRGLKNNTFENYNHIADERRLQASTIDSVYTVLHQVLDIVADADYIRMQDTQGYADISTILNIYADVTKELKKSEFAGQDSYFATA